MSIVCSYSLVLARRVGDVQWKWGWRWDVEFCPGLCSKVCATMLSAAGCTGTEPPGVWIISPGCSRAINSAYPTRMKCQPGLSLTDAFVWLGWLRGWLCLCVFGGLLVIVGVTVWAFFCPVILNMGNMLTCKCVCRALLSINCCLVALERNRKVSIGFYKILNTGMFLFYIYDSSVLIQ